MFKVTFDIKGVEKLCDDLKKELKSVKGARAGYIKDKAYPNGFSLVQNALMQEFGGVVNIPAHTSTVYKKINESGEYAKNGKFVKKKQANFAQEVIVPAHSVTIPPRPFLRNTIKRNEAKWTRYVNEMFDPNMDGNTPLKVIALNIAIMMQRDIQESILSNTPPPNKPSTIRQKGSSKTLIDTGLLLNSVQSEVIKGNNDDRS